MWPGRGRYVFPIHFSPKGEGSPVLPGQSWIAACLVGWDGVNFWKLLAVEVRVGICHLHLSSNIWSHLFQSKKERFGTLGQVAGQPGPLVGKYIVAKSHTPVLRGVMRTPKLDDMHVCKEPMVFVVFLSLKTWGRGKLGTW